MRTASSHPARCREPQQLPAAAAVARLELVDARGPFDEDLQACSLGVSGGLTVLAGTDRPGSITALRVLAGLVRPAAGRASVFGQPARQRAVRARIGHCPLGLRGSPRGSAFELCRHLARVFGASRADATDRADEALMAVGMVAGRDRPLGELSGGWQRRAMVAAALVHRPELLLVEEPLVGLDSRAVEQVTETLVDLSSSRAGVIVSLRDDAALDVPGARTIRLSQGRVVDS